MGCCDRYLGVAFHYETLKIVDIKNKKVGAVYRVIQFLILAYVIGYAIVFKKGYQEYDWAVSTVTVKLKGTAFVNFKNFSTLFNGVHVYDPSDYVIPPQEKDGFFVMTNFVITPKQTQARCPEDVDIRRNRCRRDADCRTLSLVRHGNGARTGACVASDRNPRIKVCEIYGWCPVERDALPMRGQDFSRTVPLLDEAKNFTVLIKNYINFPKFRVQRRNIFGFDDRRSFRGCTYDRHENRFCPIFKLGDILAYCGDNFTDVAYKGASYGIFINWDCDLNYSMDYCVPVYDFLRLDDPHAPISPGYNFRYTNYYVSNDTRYRTLTKAFGIRFLVLVNAKAGKFSPFPLFLNLGAGLALLGLAKVCCDFMMIYCLKRRKMYRKYKIDSFDDLEASLEEKRKWRSEEKEKPRLARESDIY